MVAVGGRHWHWHLQKRCTRPTAKPEPTAGTRPHPRPRTHTTQAVNLFGPHMVAYIMMTAAMGITAVRAGDNSFSDRARAPP